MLQRIFGVNVTALQAYQSDPEARHPPGTRGTRIPASFRLCRLPRMHVPHVTAASSTYLNALQP